MPPAGAGAAQAAMAALAVDLVERYADPQVLAREMVVTQTHAEAGPVKTLGLPVKFSNTPGGPRHPASLYGQHTREILYEAGYDDSEIDAFISQQVTVASS